MPRLKTLLQSDELCEHGTAEQLFASSIYAKETRVERQQAAKLCSASFIAMSTVAKATTSGSAFEYSVDRDAKPGSMDVCETTECVDAALQTAREGKKVLFLIRDPKIMTKRLAAAVSSPAAAMTTDLAAQCLHHIHFRQCRSIYDLLRQLDHVEQDWREMQEKEGIQLVALGPLSDYFSVFQTASGITVTGAGLKRMVDLAIKHLQTITSLHVCLLKND